MDSKYALVTGASSGIGFNYASQLSEYGYKVIMVSNREQECIEASKKIANSIAVYKDLSNYNAAEELFAQYPNVDLLVNNAGIFFYNDTINCSMERIETILNLHIITTVKLCRLYGQKMKEKNSGYILNMSSISVYTPYPGISLYTATKSFIRTFTIGLRGELQEFGIRVMVVSPGAVATDLYNLPKNLQNLGLKIGVIYPPAKLAQKAIIKLHSNKKEFIPGYINRLFSPIFSILPYSFKMYMRRKTKKLMK